jgi:hypothetical protein
MRQKIVWFILGVLVGSLFLVAAYPQGSSPKNNIPSFQKIDNGIPVYYIGNETPRYFLRTAKVSGFGKIKTPHILIVEGSYVENSSQLKQFLKEEVLSGIPVIVKDNPELLKGIFKGQFYPRVVGGQKPDGTPLGKERVYGYVTYPLPDGTLRSKVFISIDPSPESIKDAYQWAVENLQPNAGSLEIEPLSSGSYWEYQFQLDFTSGNDWKPYGRLNVRTVYYYLMNDNSASYVWYDVHMRQQSVPGKELWSDSDWRTSDMYTWIDADYYRPEGFLFDYSPTTTSGSKTSTVTIGVSAGDKGAQVSASQSWSYTISDVVVKDQSDFSQELAKWWHDVAEDKAVGENTYMIEPGATLRFPESESREWREHYGVRYEHPPEWWEPGWYWHSFEGWAEFYIGFILTG